MKKKPPITVAKEFSDDEIEPLQLVTKRSARCRSRVKRRLIENDSEEENYEKIARMSGVSNVQKILHIKAKEDSDSDDEKVNVIKRTTRRNKFGSLRKKTTQHES